MSPSCNREMLPYPISTAHGWMPITPSNLPPPRPRAGLRFRAPGDCTELGLAQRPSPQLSSSTRTMSPAFHSRDGGGCQCLGQVSHSACQLLSPRALSEVPHMARPLQNGQRGASRRRSACWDSALSRCGAGTCRPLCSLFLPAPDTAEPHLLQEGERKRE